MHRLRTLLALLLAALALLAPGVSAAKPPSADTSLSVKPPATGERILHYRSDVQVASDGSLDVTETIRVRSEGNRIQRGIYRDFPTRYERAGRRIRVGFDVESVERDGRSEPWETERIDNGVRLRIGDADVMLDDGEHLYTIRYRTTRQLGFFSDYDELYWNATGNGWIFPIDVAEARIRLPRTVQIGNRAFYTGPQGSTVTDAQVVEEQPGEILFRTTAPLGPNEGLTVAIAWPNGVVEAPPPPSPAALSLERYGPIGAAILALAGLGWFYFHAWRTAGRGPIAGTVVPLFQPPEGMSAAAIRYVRKMAFDNRAFAAAIVESGVNGKVRLIEEDKGIFSRTKTRIEQTADGDDLAPPERDMLAALFGGGPVIEMDQANHATFSSAQSNLRKGLEDAYLGSHFRTNKGWAWAGLMLIPAAMLLVGTIVGATDPYGDPGTWLVPALGLLLLLGAVVVGRRSQLAVTGGSILLAVLAILLGLGGALFAMTTFVLAIEYGRVLPMLAPLLALPLALSAFKWMAAPTKEGRATMDRIAGFEKYLSITEEDRLETLHPPEKTPELFERYLPHAIALEVENRWAARFAGVLAAAAAAPGQDRGMGWYSGSQNAWSNPGRFATAMGGTLASSVASASTAPGSSSGSGGGGSSGGGGGGGGGGGW